MNKKHHIFILLAFFLALFLILNFIDPVLLWDENVYLGNARSHIAQSNFTEDFRFPLVEYIIAFFWLFTGESIFIAKLIMIFFTLATIYVFYLIAKENFEHKHALFITALFSICPLMIEWGSKIYTEIPALFFLILSFYLLMKQKSRFIALFVIIAGILSGLSFMAKFPNALFGLAAAVFFIFFKEYRKLIYFSTGSIIALLPWLIYNFITYKNPLWDLVMQMSVIAQYTVNEPIMQQIANFFVVMAALSIFLPFGIHPLIKKRKENWIMIFYTIIFFAYYLFFVRLKFSRYYLADLAFLFILCYAGFLFLMEKIKDVQYRRFFYAAVIVFAILTAILFGFDKISSRGSCEKDGAIIQSADYLKEFAPKDRYVISNFWPWFGYYGNFRIQSIWSEDIDALIDQFQPSYFAYNNLVGVPFNRTTLDENNRLKLEKHIDGECSQEAYIYRVLN
ncbi:MAG: glycosyltransferase family 39 protein [Candidatus Woesearchaeota archaeon]|nr:glycosyltransferase family 39 protein [Candidatus Woesearchaeota archaeon]